MSPNWQELSYENLSPGVTEYNKKTGGYVSSLPSPRVVSAKVFADVEKSKRTSTESKKLSHMAMQVEYVQNISIG